MTRGVKRVSSGKYINLTSLTVDDVSLDDINNSLNCMYRFNGHYKDKKPLTVAQHTYLCMWIARQLYPDDLNVELGCLLHDMAEAYYGDIITPVKRMIGSVCVKYMDNIDAVVYNKLWPENANLTQEVHDAVKNCDNISLDIERRSMWKSQLGKENWPETFNFLPLKQKLEWFKLVQDDGDVNLIDEYNVLISKLKEVVQ